ncbi:neutral zinc metallopeptidase [Providencia stuartii]|uniref:Neutral zinc metallopeptidase n=2 Tax=Gammaproteobacteria TaxID=1236 RepID=A0AAJ1JGA6_PROST|nr:MULTISPECIES: neutral zinc metallopeptidase [Providencia]EMA3639696.1 neutral zinc metallopeptidase [Providencia stuartii]MBW3101146.1 neutral zinc metallopeptidase [Providencia stuartii]MCB5217412.1 neutral zinc metallopeptidase [Providencia stuartii]MDE8750460.1 neutral zinc metallopeptidase [Providencia thailandensis]MDE8768774.1 neutral zinc metallopeptidase [Providencia thailandensis]
MRWQDRRRSDNIEDRRSENSSGGFQGNGRGMRIPLRGKSGVVILIVIVVAGYYGVDLTGLITGEPIGNHSSQQAQNRTISPQEAQLADFTSVMLASTEDVWQTEFKKLGKQYQQPKLVIYRNGTSTACGQGKAFMGPFYCPADNKIYIDLSFYNDMKTKLGAGGEFAQGYVVAHEIGHHVQHLLGIEQQVRKLQQGVSTKEANKLSVKLELQADCFAGVWGHNMDKEGILDDGDLQSALNAAQAIGDDRLQQQSQGRVIPDSFTHGTSQQRYFWFKKGFETGDINSCNTFSAQNTF